jgi:competence protein ComEC
MTIERVALFDTRSFRLFLFFIIILASLSLLFEYSRYRDLKAFDTAEIEASVLNHYLKTKNSKTYSVLKLQALGKSFYTIASKDLKHLRGRTVLLRIWTKRLNFLEYLKGFYVHSVLLHVKPKLAQNHRISKYIAKQHHNVLMQELYGALFTATPMSPELRDKLSASGTSHLLAISGFHLGVLSLIVLGLLSWPYRFFQGRYFPYRHGHRDLFIITALVMLVYLLFLGWIPSLLRAFVMMVVGYILYDRGIKVISMQTLGVSILLLLALWPTLLFSLGFWLSVSGVFYIFLFLKYFADLKPWQIGVGIAIWVYMMMLPISLFLFESFSLWHPLSIVWSIAFFPIYLLSLLLHLIGLGGLFDDVLLSGFYQIQGQKVTFSLSLLVLHVTLSLSAIFYRRALYLSAVFAVFIAVIAIYQVA